MINEYESMIVKFIFEAFNEGKNVNTIIREMFDMGYSLKNGSLDGRNIKYLLKNKT